MSGRDRMRCTGCLVSQAQKRGEAGVELIDHVSPVMEISLPVGIHFHSESVVKSEG